jgi:hypothetical protein
MKDAGEQRNFPPLIRLGIALRDAIEREII